MTLQRLHLALLLFVLGAGPCALNARADAITGASFTWQYYFDGGALSASSPGSVTNGSFSGGSDGGQFVEPTGPDTSAAIFNVDSTDTTISFDYSPYSSSGSAGDIWNNLQVLSLSPLIYNGIAVDLTSAGESFESVTVDPSTNMTGFSSSNIYFSDDEIQVNWSGLGYSNSTEVVLDVSLESSSDNPPGAPEPGTFVSLAGGVGALMLLARRRRSA